MSETIQWVFGIIGGLLAAGVIAVMKMAIEHEHRVSVLETKVNHVDEQMDRVVEKVDEILVRHQARRG